MKLVIKSDKLVSFLGSTIGLLVSYYLLFLLVSSFFPLEIETEYSTSIVSSNNTLLHAFLTSDDKWRMYTELDEITPELKKAIIFKEDKYFYFHFGINPVSMLRAFTNNMKEGYRTSGASTISMQVARMLNRRERTYKNKLIEIFRAFQLESQLSKDEILQLYLNLVPFGSNIEGVKSASVIYFGKMPNHLSIAEIAALSIVPNRPVSLRLGVNNEYIFEESNKWLNRYKVAGLFNQEYIDDAITEPLQAYRREVPRLAPHLSYRLKTQNPASKIIHTSLDLELQRKAEQIVSEYSKRLYFQNIKNAVTLIVNNETHQVLVYIGSADFNNNEDGGQVDGIRAIRSPGSTLKPLLYGLGMDKGIITPKTIIADVPVSFSGYEPENFNEEFSGNITIEHALANSLNVPAVKLASEIEASSLIQSLIDSEFKQIKRDKNDLGLSMILGGCGVSMQELAGLFCCFANQGVYEPLVFLENQEPAFKRKILSPESTYMITEVLTQLKRPDLPVHWSNSMHTPKIAWKTGTSYGRRDAWSIGYNNKFTVGVWVGNFSGEGVPELSGAQKATPLLFQIFNAIDHNPEQDWFTIPEGLDLRYVCSQTGYLPGEYCNDLVIDYYIPGISETKSCDHLKKVFINPDSTIAYCTVCKPDLGFKTALYPSYLPEILSYFDSHNLPYKKIPPHNPACERLLNGSNPEITSPIHENEYFVNVADSMEVMLSCHSAGDVENVFWYINKKFYKSAKANEKIFFTPNEGKVEISCSDDKGRNTDIRIYVKYTSF